MPNHLFAVDSNRHPPQGASSATSGQVLRADGSDVCTWVSLGGDVSGSPDNIAVVDLTISGQATGDIIYFNGTVWVRRPATTNGFVLTLSGGIPVWAAAGGGGGGGIGGSTGATDNALLRADGTGGATLQDSPIVVADNGNITVGSSGNVISWTGSTQAVLGSTTAPMTELRLNGTTWTTAPATVIVRAPDVTPGGTNNLAGAPLSLRSGVGVGNAPTYVDVFTPSIGASGNTAQVEERRIAIGGSGTAVGIGFGPADPLTNLTTLSRNVSLYANTISSAGAPGGNFAISAGSNLSGSGSAAGGNIELNAGSTLSASTGIGGSVLVTCGTSGAGVGGTFDVLTANTGSALIRMRVQTNGGVRLYKHLLRQDQQTNPPGAPALSESLLYGRNYAERCIPEFRSELGAESILQPSLWQKNIQVWLPGLITTSAIAFGNGWAVTATQAHPAQASTNLLTSLNRATYTTTNVSGNASGIRNSRNANWRGNAAGLGGFFFFGRVAIETFHSAMQIMCGLSPTAALGGDPSARNHTVCFGKDTADTNWQLIFRDGTTATKVNLGVAVAAGDVYDVYFYAAPNSSEIIARVINAGTGVVLADDTTHTANLPGNTNFIGPTFFVRTNAAVAVAGALMKLYVESDL